MKKEILPLEITGQFPRLVLDYLSARDDMKPFYDYSPDLKGLKERIEELKSRSFDRAVLTAELTDQHKETALTEAQEKNLQALADGSGYTICTGHQLCLMTGPAYVIYKICSVIALSKELEAACNGEVRIIPLFWLASEDHDIAEIDHFSLFNKTLKFNSEHQGAAGHMSLNGIEHIITELSEILGDSDGAAQILATLRKVYDPSLNLAQATARLLNSLFASEGLLILDADRTSLKKIFIPSIKKELKESFVEKAIQPALEMLQNRGEKVQASPRGINLFYLFNGLRSRIIREEELFKLIDSELQWTMKELMVEVDAHPERFSPNVLLRPLYQETILPNVAYIGGPGELSYWLQLKGMFHAVGMKMPLAVLRDSFLFMDERSEEKWKSLGFEVKDLFKSEDDLHKAYAICNGAAEVDLIKEKESLIHHFDKLIEKSLTIDNGLAQFAKGERQRLENAVDTLEKKMVRAEKKKHSDALARISQVKEKFLPSGLLQERKENFIPIWMKLKEDLIKVLVKNSEPLNPGLKVLRD
jgi:bacillithiol biosynthesis cysteine-adding enzyme BshC